MADYLPKTGTDAAFTLTTSAAVTGGRLVGVSGAGTVAHTADDSAVTAGVAATDAASGDPVTIYPRGGIHRLTAAGAIAAGARVAPAAAGKIQTIGSKTNPIGTALKAAAADGDVIDVLLD